MAHVFDAEQKLEILSEQLRSGCEYIRRVFPSVSASSWEEVTKNVFKINGISQTSLTHNKDLDFFEILSEVLAPILFCLQ